MTTVQVNPIASERVHPAAALFPLLPEPELEALATDIRDNGLVHPIVRHQGMILDGRNRLAACRRAGVEPQFVEWPGTGSPTLWVLSVNLHRRHLTESQRALIAAKAKEPLEQEARQRQKALAGTRRGDPSAPGREGRGSGGKSAAAAAKAVHVSARSVERASKVLAKGAPELVAAVEAGAVRLKPAEALASLPEPEQRAAVERAVATDKPRDKRATKTAPVMVVEPRGFSALRKPGKTPASEVEALRCLLSVVRSGARAWTSLVLAWNEEHRADMDFAIGASGDVERLFSELLKRLERLADACDGGGGAAD